LLLDLSGSFGLHSCLLGYLVLRLIKSFAHVVSVVDR